MRETLLKDSKNHTVLDEFGVTLVFVQLAHDVEVFDE
jgi:hypothetical protein